MPVQIRPLALYINASIKYYYYYFIASMESKKKNSCERQLVDTFFWHRIICIIVSIVFAVIPISLIYGAYQTYNTEKTYCNQHICITENVAHFEYCESLGYAGSGFSQHFKGFYSDKPEEIKNCEEIWAFLQTARHEIKERQYCNQYQCITSTLGLLRACDEAGYGKITPSIFDGYFSDNARLFLQQSGRDLK